MVLREITSLINKSQSQSVGHDQDMGARPIVYTDGSCLNQGIGYDIVPMGNPPNPNMKRSILSI